jgi:hypothetical protein
VEETVEVTVEEIVEVAIVEIGGEGSLRTLPVPPFALTIASL